MDRLDRLVRWLAIAVVWCVVWGCIDANKPAATLTPEAARPQHRTQALAVGQLCPPCAPSFYLVNTMLHAHIHGRQLMARDTPVDF